MKPASYEKEPWFPFLSDGEKLSLAEWEAHRRQHREDAGVYARWIKQASDRARRRMAKENAK